MRRIRSQIYNYFKLSFLVHLLFLAPSQLQAQEMIELKLTADRLFRLADSCSTTIKLSLMRLAVSGANLEEVRSSRLPDLRVSANAGYLSNAQVVGLETMPSGNYEMPHFSNSFAIEASYVVFSGGNINRSIDIASLEKKLAQLNYEKDRADIRLMLIGNLIDLFVVQNQREIFKKNIEQTSKLLVTMEERQRKGILLRSDVLRTQLQLSNFPFGLSQVENRISIITRKLSETLGLEKNVQIVASNDLSGPVSAFDTTSFALKNNFELRQSDLQIQIAEKHAQTVGAKKLPIIALYGNNRFSRPFIYDLPALDIYANLWTAGISLTSDISSIYTNGRSLKKARLQVSQIRVGKKLAEEQVRIKLFEAYTNYKESVEHLTVAKKEQELATTHFHIIVNSYNAQLALITDLMDASTNLLRADLQIQNAEAAISFAIYNIKRVQGEL